MPSGRTRVAMATIVVGTIALAMPLAPPPSAASETTTRASDECLERGSVTTVVDTEPPFPGEISLPDRSAVDARGAAWISDRAYPVLVRSSQTEVRDAICFVGGTIASTLPHESTPWGAWHDTAAMIVQEGDFELIGTRFDNLGDGVRFSRREAQDWTVRGVRMTRVHDDCIENDWMHSGTIDDSLFDGCYVFYSARGPSENGIDGGDNTVTITDSLVRMEPMPALYDGSPGPGHGPLFKLAGDPGQGRSPRLVIRDSVFRLDQAPSHDRAGVPTLNHDRDPSTPGLPYLDPADCSGNTVVWLGEGPFPDELPSCFDITTDVSVWNLAVADWEATPAQAAAASTRVVQALIRATCGRIGT
jgi:hypothetical protein